MLNYITGIIGHMFFNWYLSVLFVDFWDTILQGIFCKFFLLFWVFFGVLVAVFIVDILEGVLLSLEVSLIVAGVLGLFMGIGDLLPGRFDMKLLRLISFKGNN